MVPSRKSYKVIAVFTSGQVREHLFKNHLAAKAWIKKVKKFCTSIKLSKIE